MKQAFLLVLFSLGLAAPAISQEKGQVGFDFNFNPSLTNTSPGIAIGPRYSFSPHFALRTTFRFLRQTTEGQVNRGTAPPEEFQDNQFGVGVSALWYFAKHEGISPYVGATYEFLHLTHSEQPAKDLLSVDHTGENNAGNLFLGLQHNFGRHFSVFGEVGVRYSKGEQLTVSTSSLEQWQFLNTGLGATLYLK